MARRVTVVIASYNGARFLPAAIESVLAQSYADFELIVVDDASTDNSREVVQRYRDSRIRLIANESNAGVAATRNRGLAAASTEYVLMLDGDDICLPDRIVRQVRFLDEHPDVAVVGTQASTIDTKGRTIGRFWRPTSDAGIRWCGIFQSPVIQSSVAVRRDVVLRELGGYDERYRMGEDFDLWLRVAKKHRIANLVETLIAYRAHPLSASSVRGHPSREGYAARKAVMVAERLREELPNEPVALQTIERWIALGDTQQQSAAGIRDVVRMIENCGARFREIHGDDADVVKHEAVMLARALFPAVGASRLLSLDVLTKIWRRDRATAIRDFPRYLFTFLFGPSVIRAIRAARRAHASH